MREEPANPGDLVLHFERVRSPLGTRTSLGRLFVISAITLLLAVLGRLVFGDTILGTFAVYIAFFAAIATVMFGYGLLRLANAGLFLSGSRVGVVGSGGGRKGVEINAVDHLQCGTLQVRNSPRAIGVLLLVDRAGRALLRLDGADGLSTEGLNEFSLRSGLALEGSWDDSYTLDELARRFPGSVARGLLAADAIQAHRTRTALITVTVTVLFFVALFVALLARSKH